MKPQFTTTSCSTAHLKWKAAVGDIKEGVNESELPCIAGESVNWQNHQELLRSVYES